MHPASASGAHRVRSLQRRFRGRLMSEHSFQLTPAVQSFDHTRGPDHAGVTVVEYGDFECPNCKQAAPAVKLLLERFEERACYVWRNYPLVELHSHYRH